MIHKSILLAALAGTLFWGCAADPWKSYDTSLYMLFKEATPESRQAHLELLERIVTRAQEAEHKALPGICAEYGWFLCLAGREQEGRRYLAKEATDYPEAHKFVQILTNLSMGRKALPGSKGDPGGRQ